MYSVRTNEQLFEKINNNVLVEANIKHGSKLMILEDVFEKISNYKYNNDFKKVKVEWFLYWQKKNDQWYRIYKELPVNHYFLSDAQYLINKKASEEFELIKVKEEIDSMRTVEQGRTYKGRLRALIMERDNNRCVICGRSAKDGITLEVDHIKEWTDGGKTTYDNGQTLCSECNKGKHHMKQYNKKVNDLNEMMQ